MRRKSLFNFLELSEFEVVKYYIRLSEMNYGVDLGIYLFGLCIMKYNFKINEEIVFYLGVVYVYLY